MDGMCGHQLFNSTTYQKNLEENVSECVKRFKLKQNWTLEHDNNLNQVS